MNLKALIGCGDKIGLFALPFIVVGMGLNIWRPEWFTVGGPTTFLEILSIIILIPGIVNWGWCVYLIVTEIPQKKLITSGPFSLAKHPLYTGVAILVLPWCGFLLNSWMGLVFGAVLYVGRRLYAKEEEKELSEAFGAAWEDYTRKVVIPWL